MPPVFHHWGCGRFGGGRGEGRGGDTGPTQSTTNLQWGPACSTRCGCARGRACCGNLADILPAAGWIHHYTQTTNHHSIIIIIINRIPRRNLRYFTASSLCRELSPTHTLKWPRRNHVQITCKHTEALIMCNMLCYVPHGTKGQLSYQVWQS